MRVAIVTVQVPFTRGGAEAHAVALRTELERRGCRVDIVTIPFKWYPPTRLLDCMLMARLVDVTEVNGQRIDRVIALKFPAYYAEHPHKVGWILHQHRQAYELYGTEHSELHLSAEGRRVTAAIQAWDDALFRDFRRMFANSETVATRLKTYNGVTAEPLYHPPPNHDRLYCGDAGAYILYPGRFDHLKRQHLIVEAMVDAPRALRLVLIGSAEGTYAEKVLRQIAAAGVADRVEVRGPVSEEEKIRLYAGCLAVYNGVFDEDYGYVTLEALMSGKPVITHSDSGGPLEFVTHEANGYVVAPEPEALRACLDRLAARPDLAREMGQQGREMLGDRRISWDYVIERLMA
jgi:glycosyltransferase involved in cell wall biosynthesis